MTEPPLTDDWQPMAEERGSAGGPSLSSAAPAVAAGAFELLSSLPRLIGGALEDLRAIARSTQHLPELPRLLGEIDRGIKAVQEEVVRIRKAVESMEGNVEGLNPHLEDLQDAIPFNRKRNRDDGDSS
jgi:hypothetical protein